VKDFKSLKKLVSAAGPLRALFSEDAETQKEDD
jgi:hypothetical protein